jgi:hypothetical protein
MRPASLDGLKSDGAGGVVQDDNLALSLGMSARDMTELERDIAEIAGHGEDWERHSKIANILVVHLNHEERMCALDMYYDANTAPCSGKRLCRLQKRVQKKLWALPEKDLQLLWHLL